MSLASQIAELVEAAEDSLLVLDQAFGGDTCDHDANVCFCEIFSTMDRLRAALDSLEGRFQKAA